MALYFAGLVAYLPLVLIAPASLNCHFFDASHGLAEASDAAIFSSRWKRESAIYELTKMQGGVQIFRSVAHGSRICSVALCTYTRNARNGCTGAPGEHLRTPIRNLELYSLT